MLEVVGLEVIGLEVDSCLCENCGLVNRDIKLNKTLNQFKQRVL